MYVFPFEQTRADLNPTTAAMGLTNARVPRSPSNGGDSGTWADALFEASDDAALIHDADGRILDANPAACRRLGYSREEILLLYLRDLEAPELAGTTNDSADVRQTARSFQGVHIARDGRRLPAEITRIRIEAGGRTAFVTLMRDVSRRPADEESLERRRIERALRDSEALFESLVESLPQNIFRKDRQGRFTFANRRFCDTVKKPLAEILGRTDFDLYPEEMASKYVRDDRHLLETGTPLETVEEHRLPDGRQLFVQVVKTVVQDAQSEVVGVQGMFWDVTEKWQAEARVAQSERRYRQLTEATLDAIVVTDEAGIVLLFNPAAERMFGFAASEVVGRPADFLASRALQAARDDALQRFQADPTGHGTGDTREMVARRKDGSEFPVEIALSALSLSGELASRGRVHFLGAIRDLTERYKMRATLIQNEKLASIGLLSAGVAHEINNPLSFVSNNLVVLQRDCQGLFELVDAFDREQERLAEALPELARAWKEKADDVDVAYLRENLPRLLARTRDGVERVTRIVHSLRGMARTDSPKRQPTSLAELIDANLEILRGRFKRSGIEVIQEHDGSPILSCVSTHIGQVILNMLVNAFQAVESARPEGGKIWIRTRHQEGTLVLEIADNGPGIAPEVLPRIFDPFFTTKEVGVGTGLGLSISHQIILGHGGRVEVESSPGAGACFRMHFPLS